MKRRFACAFSLVAGLLSAASCDASSAARDPVDAGDADGGGSGGSGGNHPRVTPGTGGHGTALPDGSSGRAFPVVMCGSSTCAGSSMFAACCVDAATSTCGVENKLVGVSCGVPAVADPGCPPVSVDFAGTVIMVQGCCTESGVCGGFNLGSPCALTPMHEDDDGGASARAPRACRRAD